MKDFKTLSSEVLSWLDQQQVPGTTCEYYFGPGMDATIFGSCFALFIYDLFGETSRWSAEKRQIWIDFLQSYQREDGLFEPREIFHKDPERNRYQLSCFCLSALGILGAKPARPLQFVDELWPDAEAIEKTLRDWKVEKGASGSGNKAMFLGLFLTYQYEFTGASRYLDLLDVWFEYHKEHQHPDSGFWGPSKLDQYHGGMQNAFHQFVVYYYWDRPVPRSEKVVQRITELQNTAGSFSQLMGGDACHEYDCVHILVNGGLRHPEQREQLRPHLEKVGRFILKSQQADGGFCQSKAWPGSPGKVLSYLPQIFSGKVPYIWSYRTKVLLYVLLKEKNLIHTGWTRSGRKWEQSNLWDTWFRCLTLAEIDTFLNGPEQSPYRYHRVAGLGNFMHTAGQKPLESSAS